MAPTTVTKLTDLILPCIMCAATGLRDYRVTHDPSKEPCRHCGGTGHVLNPAAGAQQVRDLVRAGVTAQAQHTALNQYLASDARLRNALRDAARRLELSVRGHTQPHPCNCGCHTCNGHAELTQRWASAARAAAEEV